MDKFTKLASNGESQSNNPYQDQTNKPLLLPKSATKHTRSSSSIIDAKNNPFEITKKYQIGSGL
jgi:hypothetical protein